MTKSNVTSSRKQPSSKQLLLLLGLSASTMTASSAFQNHQVVPARVWGQPSVPANKQQQDPVPVRESTSNRTPKYDLGLGKNLPVASTVTRDSMSAHDSTEQAVAYLVEHDAAMDYPSPDMVRQHRERLAQAQAITSKTKQPLPAAYTAQQRVIRPLQKDGQFVVDRSTMSDLDMNTAWVQLLYLEQQKLASASASGN